MAKKLVLILIIFISIIIANITFILKVALAINNLVIVFTINNFILIFNLKILIIVSNFLLFKFVLYIYYFM